jgi:hypothetical protein
LFTDSLSITISQLAQDSLALVDLYNSTNGSGWTRHANWLTAAPLSSWFGVVITNGRVTSLGLSNDNLQGSIPSALGNLSNLTRLYLNNNQLTDSIPSSFINLINLTDFEIIGNHLSGSLSPIAQILGGFSTDTSLYHNNFTFSSFENVINIPSPQAKIPLHQHGNLLSVSAGGTLSNNTYKWYNGNTLVATKIADSTFTPSNSGTYSVAVTNSIVTLITLRSDSIVVTISATTRNATITSCHSILFENTVYNRSAVVVDTTKSSGGADSIYLVTSIVINPIVPVAQSSIITGINSVTYRGITYTSSTSITDTLKSSGGCDSVYHTTTITVPHTTAVVQDTTINSCHSILYNGQTYSTSTILDTTIKDVNGFDSVYKTVSITINSIVPTSSDTVITASGDILFHGKIYSSSALTIDTLQSIGGCDSAYFNVRIIINRPTPVVQDSTINSCHSIVYDGQTYFTSAVIDTTIKDINGLDSIYKTIRLVINSITPQLRDSSISATDSVAFNGRIYYHSSSIIDTLKSTGGCDSVYITATITINHVVPPVVQTTNITSCHSVLFEGITYDVSATVTDTIKSIQNFDSIYHVTSIIINPIVPQIRDSSVNGVDSVVFNGVTYTASATVTNTIKSVGGCDSIYTVTMILISDSITNYLFANIDAYPNPAHGTTNIVFATAIPAAFNIQITNLSGGIVTSIKGGSLPGKNTVMVPLQNYLPGIYIVTVINSAGKYQFKLNVQ